MSPSVTGRRKWPWYTARTRSIGSAPSTGPAPAAMVAPAVAATCPATAARSTFPLVRRGSSGTTAARTAGPGRPVRVRTSSRAGPRSPGESTAIPTASSPAASRPRPVLLRGCPGRTATQHSRDPGLGQQGLQVAEVDPQAEGLGDAAAAADHLPQAVGAVPCDVAGVELVDRGPERQVPGLLGVAQHDVGPGVDQLARGRPGGPGVRPGRRGVGVQTERAPGDGDPDGLWVVVGQRRRQPGHPRRGLGLAVHDHEVEAPVCAERRPPPDVVGSHPPAGLGDGPQRGRQERVEPGTVEQGEGVGDPGEGGDAGRRGQVPAAGVDHTAAREHHRCAGQQVGVQHGQAVAVVQGQRGQRPVAGGDAQVVDDGRGVGCHVCRREADQLG